MKNKLMKHKTDCVVVVYLNANKQINRDVVLFMLFSLKRHPQHHLVDDFQILKNIFSISIKKCHQNLVHKIIICCINYISLPKLSAMENWKTSFLQHSQISNSIYQVFIFRQYQSRFFITESSGEISPPQDFQFCFERFWKHAPYFNTVDGIRNITALLITINTRGCSRLFLHFTLSVDNET